MSEKNIVTTQNDGIRVFEPALKNADDQLQSLITRIEEIKNPSASPENYVGAFSHDTDQVFVQTGNANVTQVENLSAMLSPAPEVKSDNTLFYLIGFGLVAFLIFKGRK